MNFYVFELKRKNPVKTKISHQPLDRAASDDEAFTQHLPPDLAPHIPRSSRRRHARSPASASSPASPAPTASRDRRAWRHGRGRSTGRVAIIERDESFFTINSESCRPWS